MAFLTFTTSRDLAGSLTNNSTAENKALMEVFINQKLGEIYSQRDWHFLYATDTTRSTVASQQFYDLPGDLGKLISTTVQFNTYIYSPKRAPNRQAWDRINATAGVKSDSPEWWYPFAGGVGYYPTPNSANGSIAYNYKKKDVELSIADFTGTVESATNGNKTIITGLSDLTSALAGLWIRIDKGTASTSGDGRWYEIDLIATGSSIALKRPYKGDTFSAAANLNYTIGQASLLPENFHQLPIYGAVAQYYSSVKPEQNQFTIYNGMYVAGLAQLQREHGQAVSDPSLEDIDERPFENPNFFVTTT